MPNVLAISPHLDDAIFSAGGALARYAREGWRVVVATIFTASVPKPQGFALACQLDKGLPADVDYMALRRNEDAAACACIDAEPIWLPFREAPHRGYASAEALFSGLRDFDGIVDPIAAAIARLIDAEAPDIVLAPQAVGAHVDHIAVYAALARLPVPARLWTDFPYALRPTIRPSPFAEDIRSFEQSTFELNEKELEAKLSAVLCYASQLGFQFGGAEFARTAIASCGTVEHFAVAPRRTESGALPIRLAKQPTLS